MADTMFNIFGDHLSNPAHRQILRVNKTDENNGSVGKPGLSSALTPAKKSMNSLTPRDFKKKSFLQNMSTPIQGHSKGDYRRAALQSTQKTFLQIYEDTPLPVQPHISPEDMIQIEYTRRTHFNDDGDLSDSDLVMTDEHIDKLVMNLPGSTPPHQKPNQKFEMNQPMMHLDLGDILSDDMFNSSQDDLNTSDMDIPHPFDF